MPTTIIAKWPSHCAICEGEISYGDKIVIYKEMGKGYSKNTHHLQPGCSLYTGEKIYVDEDMSIEEIRYIFSILQKIHTIWAVDQIVEIAKMDVTPTYHNESIELAAFEHLIFNREEELGIGGLLSKIDDISRGAKKVNVKDEARAILQSFID